MLGQSSGEQRIGVMNRITFNTSVATVLPVPKFVMSVWRCPIIDGTSMIPSSVLFCTCMYVRYAAVWFPCCCLAPNNRRLLRAVRPTQSSLIWRCWLILSGPHSRKGKCAEELLRQAAAAWWTRVCARVWQHCSSTVAETIKEMFHEQHSLAVCPLTRPMWPGS